MKQLMGRIMQWRVRGRAVVSVLLSCAALTGCALWGTDQETVTICKRGFANDLEWARASPLSRTARALWKKPQSIEFEGNTAQPSKATTIWFKNDTSPGFASCSRHSCDTGRCLWRVRMYARVDGQWAVRMEYDLGRPRHGKP